MTPKFACAICSITPALEWLLESFAPGVTGRVTAGPKNL